MMDSHPTGRAIDRCNTDRGNLSEVLAALARAYEQLDAAALVRFYTEDSEWLDTLGRRARGRTQIQAQVAQLFECGWIAGDSLSPQAVINVKALDHTLALAWISTAGSPADHAQVTSGEVPRRRMHRMQVLRQSNARWLVVTEVVMGDTSIARGKPATAASRDSRAHEGLARSEGN